MLRRLWQWLKRLFRRLFSNQQASPPGKQTQVKPLQPLTDVEYEALFFQLLAGVGEGWTRGQVKAFLDTQHINQADLVVWLRSSGERLLAAPPGNEELAQRMVLLGRLDVGEVGNLAGEIGQQLERGRPSGQDNNIEDLLNQGIGLLDLELYEQAIACFDRVIAINPDEQKAWQNRGTALRKLGRYEEAIASFNQASKLASKSQHNNHEFWFDQGVQQSAVGNFEEALAAYDQALLFKPDDHQAWNNRGIALRNLGRDEEALAAYDQALLFKPDDHEAWNNRGTALGNLGRDEEALAAYDQALLFKPDFHEAWLNRGIASRRSVSVNQPHSLLLGIVQSNPELNKRGYEGELASYHEGLKYCPQDTDPEGFGRLHQAIGKAHYLQGKASKYRTAYYNKAVSSYNQALKTLTEADFPQLHLDVLRDLISVQLDLGELDQAQELQRRGTDLLRRLLDGCQIPREKQRLGLKFAGFQQLTVDLAVQSGQMVQALELAEQGKNACLIWLLTGWSDTSLSWEEIQQLLNPTTAIVYWHLSPYALHTFILTANAEPIVKPGDNRLDDFAAWVETWNNQYNQGKKEDQQPTTWRVDLSHRLQELAQILDISTIVDTIRNSLSPIQNLILIPHRDLHRFPIHALFPDDFTITYLPSAHMGISLKGRQQPHIQAIPNLPLLSVEHPSSTGYPLLEFAEVESVAITRMFPNHTRYPSAEATKTAVMAALPQGYGIFHFTGHGTYEFRNPTSSALMLAGDDRLTLADMENLDLTGYKLVTLAACETAITGNQTITTEFVGLSSGFMWCGVSHVVSTLWNVESAPSTILMIQFYHLLQQGKGVAVALAEASRWLRDVTNAQLAEWYGGEIASLSPNEEMMERFLSRRLERLQQSSQPNYQPYNDPYFWSAFTITGIFPHEPHSSF